MEENKEIIAIIVAIGVGAFSVLASMFNWDFVFEGRKARTFTKLLGRNGTRIFYLIIGFTLFFLAYKMMTNPASN